MLWIGIAVAAAVVLVAVVVYQVASGVAEVRKHATNWDALASTQRKHEITLQYLHQLVNPMARSGHAPLPRHLQQEKTR